MKVINSFLCDLRLYLCNHVVANIPSRCRRMLFYSRIMGFTLGKQTSIFLKCRFDCAKNLAIGSPSVINQGCRLDSRGGLRIGNNVSISEEVCILTADHDPKTSDFRGRPRPVVIEDYVFIGTRALRAVRGIDGDHDPKTSDFRGRPRPVVIEDYVFI